MQTSDYPRIGKPSEKLPQAACLIVCKRCSAVACQDPNLARQARLRYSALCTSTSPIAIATLLANFPGMASGLACNAAAGYGREDCHQVVPFATMTTGRFSSSRAEFTSQSPAKDDSVRCHDTRRFCCDRLPTYLHGSSRPVGEARSAVTTAIKQSCAHCELASVQSNNVQVVLTVCHR